MAAWTIMPTPTCPECSDDWCRLDANPAVHVLVPVTRPARQLRLGENGVEGRLLWGPAGDFGQTMSRRACRDAWPAGKLDGAGSSFVRGGREVVEQYAHADIMAA